MYDMLKLALVLAAIIIGIQKRIFVGYTLFVAGLVVALLFGVDFGRIIHTYWDVLLSERFITLFIIIVLITFLGRLLREIGYLDRLVTAGKDLSGGARTAAAVIPALVGLMPMPGGSLLSAPLVSEVLHGEKYKPEFITAVNYWSRHVVEFCWPVYPGIILSAALASVPVSDIALLQFPMTIIMVPVGFIFLIRKINNGDNLHGHILKPAGKILLTVWPIILIITLYAVLPIQLLWAVAMSLLVLIVIERPSMVIIKSVAGEALSIRLFALVFGIISFQQMLEISGAVDSIPRLTTELGLPATVVIFAVSFTSGLLTGMVTAFVGLAYPLLAGYLYQPDVNFGNIFLAYISGYFGMMLSPTHFCLILTTDYFKADLSRVYKVLIMPLSTLLLIGIIMYLSGYPKWLGWP